MNVFSYKFKNSVTKYITDENYKIIETTICEYNMYMLTLIIGILI